MAAADDQDPTSGRFMERAKALRDGPVWLGVAPLGILGATVLATAFGVVATLAVLFVGAGLWGYAVWWFTRPQ